MQQATNFRVRPRPCENADLLGFRVLLYPSRAATKPIQRSEGSRFLVVASSGRFHTALYGHRPVCQIDLNVMLERGTGCSLISGLWCKPKPAGPDGMRQERPHLGHAHVVQGCVQVCVPAVLPVSPSHGNRPQQPIGTALRLRVCQAGFTLM